MQEPAQQTMLIAFDGSAEARRAFEYAAALLRPSTALVLTAWEPLHRQAARAAGGAGMMQHDFSVAVEPTDEDPAYARALEISHEGVELAESLGLHAQAHLVESATTTWSALVDAAQQLKPDVVVTGTRAITGVRSWFTSSTSENLVNNVGLPVFIVPPALEDAEDTEHGA